MRYSDNYPPGVTDADIAAFWGPDPADIPDGTLDRLAALKAALAALDAACAALIAADEDDIHIGGYCPSDLRPDADTLGADMTAAAQKWADERAEAQAEYLRDEAMERRWRDD